MPQHAIALYPSIALKAIQTFGLYHPREDAALPAEGTADLEMLEQVL